MLPAASVYDRVPLLETHWQGMSSSRVSFLAQSEAWYVRRLQNMHGPIGELACGYGRLLLPLACQGVPVYGCDASPQRIAAARQYFAQQKITDCHFEVSTMPTVPKWRGLQAVMLALNGIGYVRTLTDKQALFRNIASMLQPGGLFLMDYRRGSIFMRLLRHWPGLHGNVHPDGAHLKSHLHWDHKTHSICETFALEAPEGQHELFRDYFSFTGVSATKRMLRNAGFRIEAAYGSYSDTPFRPWSRMIAIVARYQGPNHESV